VIELRSETDNLKLLQDKMQEYIDNGTELDQDLQQFDIKRATRMVKLSRCKKRR
jgi:Uma2 family endonuclease